MDKHIALPDLQKAIAAKGNYTISASHLPMSTVTNIEDAFMILMSGNQSQEKFIPALRFQWLT